MDLILQWVSHYGYFAIFFLLMFGIIGLPIPDETMLVFSGYLIARGRLHPGLAALTAFLGSVSGITTSYLIGRTLGLGFVHKYGRYIHLTESRLENVHRWFNRIGHWALFVGYYIAGVRHFTALVAGTSCLEFRAFAKFAWSGAFVWVCTFLAIGYYFADQWENVAHLIHTNLLVASAVVILAILCVVAVRWMLLARRRSLP